MINTVEEKHTLAFLLDVKFRLKSTLNLIENVLGIQAIT